MGGGKLNASNKRTRRMKPDGERGVRVGGIRQLEEEGAGGVESASRGVAERFGGACRAATAATRP